MGLELLFIVIATWVSSMFFHELGHWGYLVGLKKESSIIFTIEQKKVKLYTWISDEDWLTLPTKNRIDFYMAGIILGIFPLLILAQYYAFFYSFLIIYLIPITSDIEAIQKLKRDKDERL